MGWYETETEKGFVYNAPPTISRFMQSRAVVKFIIGPYGSGKTTGCIFHMLQIAATQAPAPNGIRYTRFAIIRNTIQQLKTTVLKDMQQILNPIIDYRVSENTIYIRQGDIHCEILLIPLDTPEDQRRLLSTQLTCAYVNEFREVPFELIPPLLSRVGRYPSHAFGGPTYHCIMGDSNPFSEGTDWHDALIVNLPSRWDFFRQPGGRSPDAENIENLVGGRDYYDRLAEGRKLEWVKVHIDGELGDDLSGQAVYGKLFSYDWHVAPEPILVNPVRPLVIGMDFGRTPCAVIGQETAQGTVAVLDEIVTDGMGLETFLDTELMPLLRSERYMDCKLFVVFDPAGMHKSQLSEESHMDVLKRKGLACIPAPTNDLDPRLRAVEQLLMRSVRGEPGLLLDPSTYTLQKALKFEYKYQRLRTGRIEDKPAKTHPWSDIVDSLQYMALGLNSGVVAKAISRSTRAGQMRQRPQVSAMAWT